MIEREKAEIIKKDIRGYTIPQGMKLLRTTGLHYLSSHINHQYSAIAPPEGSHTVLIHFEDATTQYCKGRWTLRICSASIVHLCSILDTLFLNSLLGQQRSHNPGSNCRILMVYMRG